MSIIHLTENLTKQIPDEIEERDGSASRAAETIVALPVHMGAGRVNPDDGDVYHDRDDYGDPRSHGGVGRVNPGDDDVYHDGNDDGEGDYDGDLRSHLGVG